MRPHLRGRARQPARSPPDHRHHLRVALAELAGLRWCDIDFAKRTLTVAQTLREFVIGDDGKESYKGALRAVPYGKTDESSRVVDLPQVAIDALRERQRIAKGEARSRRSPYCFTASNGSPLRASNFNRRTWRDIRMPLTAARDDARAPARLQFDHGIARCEREADCGTARSRRRSSHDESVHSTRPYLASRWRCHLRPGVPEGVLILVAAICCHLSLAERGSFVWFLIQVRFGDAGARTPDPLLAKQVLYQLSYIPPLRMVTRDFALPSLDSAQVMQRLRLG